MLCCLFATPPQPVDAVKLIDAHFSPDGLSVVASDEMGFVYRLGAAPPEATRGARDAQFLQSDFNELIRDERGRAHGPPAGPLSPRSDARASISLLLLFARLLSACLCDAMTQRRGL